jgi:nicotinamidase-related amidase
MALQLDDDHVALLIIDMQNAAVHPSGTFTKLGFDVSPMQAIVPPIKTLITAFQKKYAPNPLTFVSPFLIQARRDLPILFIKMEWSADYSDAGLLITHPPGPAIKQIKGYIRDTWDTDVIEEFKPFIPTTTNSSPNGVVANTTTFSKSRNSAFHSTNLARLLREKGITHLVVTGCLTNACVEGTVRDGFSDGFVCVVPRECTATVSESARDASLENMVQWGDVVGVDEVLKALGGS